MTPAPLFVVGLGPGMPEMRTPQASRILRECACLAGYPLYLDMIEPGLKADKRIIASGMRAERERCEAAIAAALGGEATAIVCSGDPGIYALASLALEILAARNLLAEIPFEVVSGVPAFCAAAASVGAPIGHDFCCVSLSDLLTNREVITKRLHAAFAADFVCVLYNPRSRGRPDILDMAMNVAKSYRDDACPVALCRNIGRPGAACAVCALARFDPEMADMLSLVIVGNSQSRQVGNFMLTPRGYNVQK